MKRPLWRTLLAHLLVALFAFFCAGTVHALTDGFGDPVYMTMGAVSLGLAVLCAWLARITIGRYARPRIFGIFGGKEEQ